MAVRNWGTNLEQQYIDEIDRIAESRGWSKADVLRAAISALGRETGPDASDHDGMRQRFDGWLTEILLHLDRQRVREAGRVLSEDIPDAEVRGFAWFLANHVHCEKALIANLARERAARQMISAN
jgi:hypothetical protein